MAPLPSVCKVNTDGSRINSSGLIGARGLLRDSYGSWIKGFSVNLGNGSIIESELWGIFWGLNMTWDAGFRMVEIECDATYHIFREQNCATDALAAKSYEFGLGLHVFLEALAFLSAVLAADVRGVARPLLSV
ncbi:hypothetical protein L3X38_000799 [Prunus dulcis]|uniref:RNase H type-1 domain-containing protein n=1 Tax=Prunus dulcis TaxID=3755 RepID=A0AAD4WTB9_PRUDU|nr:hypothetical protein L3X38_000799 [Prunus dulcis]